MASVKDTATFFTEGTASQFQYVLSLYPQVLRLKADSKKKPEELVKLDNWYQNELPKKIRARGREAHCTHEELVQLMKWKQARGKFYPQVNYLVKVNTPRAVLTETKKAFKKLPNLEQALTALQNLKGVGTTMASALLAAAAPDIAPFMADECLKAIPEIEGIDYTTKEYLNFVSHIQNTTDRLSKETENGTWSVHTVELALWTHFVAKELKPELLDSIPCANGSTAAINVSHQNGDANTPASNSPSESAEGGVIADNPDNTDDTTGDAACLNDTNEDTSSMNEDSLDKASVTRMGDITNDDEVTNDSVLTSDSTTNDSVDVEHKNNDILNINEETCSSFLEPPTKKVKMQHENNTEENNIQNSDNSSIETK